ncbi:ABC transporter ATP-binding protein [Rhodobacteraceae bacterium DSL-40]|uniref:ABC transporter ATP-binding protein n=1 Tax=Amaricoccus sp. B4 TaxID=3368557 RepID=UPI000DAECB05
MIEIDAITKTYGETTVVDAVSLTVETGRVAAIVGTSGSGKTTLLRMINRLVEPSSGAIRIDGEDTRALPPHVLRRRIGYAIQGHGLFPHRTVAENIGTVPELLGWDRARIAARVGELLELFQLDPAEYRDRMPHELSGGQQQRVGVARALAGEPGVLLMDEPFGALDPVIRLKAQDDLAAIQRRIGTTIVLVTHDMDEAIRLGDAIAVMDEGRLLQYAPPAEIIARPATEFVGALVGAGERPYRMLSLISTGEVAEPGTAEGTPIDAAASARDAVSELLWSGREAAPVLREGAPLGQVRLSALLARAAGPR